MNTCSLCNNESKVKGLCLKCYMKSYNKTYSKRKETIQRIKAYRSSKEYKERKKWCYLTEEQKEKKRAYSRKYKQTITFKTKRHEYEQHPERKAKHRKNILQRRNIVFNHYGSKCACCGESNQAFLSIDHINNDGAEHRKEIGNGTSLYFWLIKNNFPDGFQTLCMNCNCAKAWWGRCPHQS